MHSANYAVARCPSVYPSHTAILPKQLSGSHTIFHTKRCGNTPTGTPLTWALNARGYEKIAIFDQYLALSLKRCKIEP